jgi:hypothetical protein
VGGEMLCVFLHLGSSTFDGLVQYSIAGRERETRDEKGRKTIGIKKSIKIIEKYIYFLISNLERDD